METNTQEQRDGGTPSEGGSTVSEVQTNEVKIADLQRWAGENAAKKGFRERGDLKDIPELIALMHSELSEALEEYRNGHGAREIYFTTDADGLDKPEGIAVEMADCVIRIMHWFHNHKMDLGAVCAMKLRYNEKRPHKHGNKVI